MVDAVTQPEWPMVVSPLPTMQGLNPCGNGGCFLIRCEFCSGKIQLDFSLSLVTHRACVVCQPTTILPVENAVQKIYDLSLNLVTRNRKLSTNLCWGQVIERGGGEFKAIFPFSLSTYSLIGGLVCRWLLNLNYIFQTSHRNLDFLKKIKVFFQ